MKHAVRFILIILLALITIQPTSSQSYVLDTLAVNPDIAFPVAMAFVPGASGKFFFTEKNNGRIRIFEGNTLRSTPFATVGVTSNGEQGLLGIAVHPEYPDSPYVFVYYTRSGDRANTVVRFRDSSDIGIDPKPIFTIPRLNSATNHNGGNIHFGPDQKLYVSVGENATSSNAQDTSASNPRGKILRLNPDGSIPGDNPFPGKPFWSFGHRNSFDFTWDPLSGKMYCSENGPSCNDEVNRVPRGANLGWPVDGNCVYSGNPNYTRPLYYFPNSPLPALTGIIVYRGDAFPRLRGHILFTGNSNPTIWSLTLSASGDTIVPESFTTFFNYSTGFADIEEGPDGDLYVTNGPYSANRVLRLRPVLPAFSSSAPDSATQDLLYSYTPTFTGTPPTVEVLVGPAGMTVDTASWTVEWTPTNAQALEEMHQVLLRAVNGAGITEQVLTIHVRNVNDPPEAFDLVSPSNDTTFNFSGSDPEITFEWEEATDPDLDTVEYIIQRDTVGTFDSPTRQDSAAGVATSLHVVLPRQSREYYWRVAATDGRDTVLSSEVRRLNVSFVTSVVHETKKEEESGLEQNFPNPFNPTTKIKYTIPKSGHVRLAVFNLLGQEVALIFEGYQNAGSYEVTFNSAELPTGIYFYRIQSPAFVETKKMIITK